MMNKKAATFYALLIARIPKGITSTIIEHENAHDTFTLRNQELIMNIGFNKSHLTFASMRFKHGKKYCIKGKLPIDNRSSHVLLTIIEEFLRNDLQHEKI